ncbi:hypothetical protein ACJX0J_025148, partial [Zea mays]
FNHFVFNCLLLCYLAVNTDNVTHLVIGKPAWSSELEDIGKNVLIAWMIEILEMHVVDVDHFEMMIEMWKFQWDVEIPMGAPHHDKRVNGDFLVLDLNHESVDESQVKKMEILEHNVG